MEVKNLVKEIKDNLKQSSSSQKDEVRVMQAMLHDQSYEVGVYNKSGEVDTYNPAKDFRAMCTGIIASTTKITKNESAQLMENYEASKSDAATMVAISKEFVNTYLETGRKLPLGGREDHTYSLSKKEVKESVRSYPKKVGVSESGEPTYEIAKKNVPAHTSIKSYGPCPSWIK